MAIKEFKIGFLGDNYGYAPDLLINIWKANSRITSLKIELILKSLTFDSSKVSAELRYSNIENPKIYGQVPATLGAGNIVSVNLPEVITKEMGNFHCDINLKEGEQSISTESFFLRNIEPPESLMQRSK